MAEPAFVPGLAPESWKEFRKRPRDPVWMREWVRTARPATPPFVARKLTPEDMMAARALKRAKQEHDEALDLVGEVQMEEAIQKLRDALRHATLAVRGSVDPTLTKMASLTASQIKKSLNTFGRVMLAGPGQESRFFADLAEDDDLIGQVVNKLIGNPTGQGPFELGMAIGWVNEAKKFAAATGRTDIEKIAGAMLKAAQIKALAKRLGI